MTKRLLSLFLILCISTCLFSCTGDGGKSQQDFEFKIEGDLPDIGKFSASLAGERFYEEPTYEFIPSEEYGAIVSYIGGMKKFTAERENAGWQRYYSYGFCTPDGKIVMDADFKTSISHITREDGFSYYQMVKSVEDINGMMTDFPASRQYIISEKGDWMIEIPEGAYLAAVGGGIISTARYFSENDRTEINLYDYSGNHLRTLEGYDSISGFYNGIASAFTYDRTDYMSMSYVINLDGEILCGPYSSIGVINDDGIMSVSDITTHDRYLVNLKGERLTHKYYRYLLDAIPYGEHPGYFIGVSQDEKVYDIYTSDGKFWKSVPGDGHPSIRFSESGEVVYAYNSNNQGIVWKRLSDDSDLVSLEYGVMANTYNGDGDNFVYINEDEKYTVIYGIDGKTKAYLEGVTEIGGIRDDYITYYTGEISYDDTAVTSTRKTYIYDVKEKKVVREYDGNVGVYFLLDGKYLKTTRTENEFSFFYMPYYDLYDFSEDKLILQDAQSIMYQIVDGKTYFNVCYDNACILYDENFKPILRHFAE